MITPAYSPTATERVLPRLALDFTTGVLDPRVTVTRALNTATRVNSSGLIELVNANLPRFDYDPISLLPRGLLIEEQRANLFTRSAELDVAPWNKGAATVTANSAVAPDGTFTADKIVATATTTFHSVYQSVIETVAQYTFSAYAKAAEYSKVQFADVGSGTWSATFDLATGTTIATGGAAVLSSSIQPAANGFYRCSVTFTGVAALTAHSIIGYPNTGATLNNFGASYAGDGTSGIYAWGLQVEAGAFATSYIPTTTTSLTRNADVVSMTGTNFSSWYNSAAGSFVAVFDALYPSAPVTAEGVLGVGSNGRIAYFSSNALSSYDGATVISGASGLAANTQAKVAMTYATGVGRSISVNGAAAVTGALSGTFGGAPTTLYIGDYNGTRPLNGHVAAVRFYPQKLTNSEAQAFSK